MSSRWDLVTNSRERRLRVIGEVGTGPNVVVGGYFGMG